MNQQTNSIHQAQISNLSHDGRGIANIRGKTTFIENALPGEIVNFKYLKRHNRFDEAYAIEIISPAPERVAPKCSVYGTCGGCSLQHLAASSQIIEKQKVLENQLQHIGNVTPQRWLDPLYGSAWGYRHKARLGVSFIEKKSELVIGFREKNNSHLITQTQQCEILHPHVGLHVKEIKSMINSLDNKKHIAQIEVAVGDDATSLILRHLAPFSINDIQQLKAFAQQYDFAIYLQPNKINSTHRIWPESGSDLLSYHLVDHDLTMQFHPSDFTQINPEINRQMINLALELLNVNTHDNVLDLFCGLGNFTLPLAKYCNQVLGIEGDEKMVERARQNARNNQINNAQFLCANLFDFPNTNLLGQQQFTKMLLDPPRTGALEICQHARGFGAQKIVYVSCNPATLARDAGEIVHKQNYRLIAAGVIDQFPHTTHVEAIALFETKKKK